MLGLALALGWFMGVCLPGMSAPGFVHHERSLKDATLGHTSTTCLGAQPFLDVLSPASGQSHAIRYQVGYGSSADTFRVYYTTDGSTPGGSFGVGSGATQVLVGARVCEYQVGADVLGVIEASIPGQPTGTVVKYVLSAYASSDLIEVFGESATCEGCSLVTNASQAVVFQYAVEVGPQVVIQPMSLTVNQGQPAILSVTATGSEPLAYQWYLNDEPLANDTNATLSIPSAQPVHAGTYIASISNPHGTVFSREAKLTVLRAPVMVVQPMSLTVTQGQSAIFSALAVGSEPLRYQWQFNGAALTGETNPVLTVMNAQSTNTGSYILAVTNDVGGIHSAQAILTVLIPPSIVSGPNSQSVVLGNAATLMVEVAGTGPFFFQWVFNGTNILQGATNASLTISNAQVIDEGTYRVLVSNPVGVAASPVAVLSVLVPPRIVTQPADRSVAQGFSVLFGVVAEGSAPLFYQWRRDGTPMEGRTNATLLLTNVQPADAAVYDVLVINAAGVDLSRPASLRVLTAPVITHHPVSLIVTQGNTATFEVQAEGAVPLSYRWYFNGTNLLAGATNTSLVLTNVQPAQEGSYLARVSNSVGVATSTAADLILRRPPIIVQPPQNLAVLPGANATFTVVVTGEEPLLYQWYFESNAIENATTATLTLTNVQPSELGHYAVRITNSVGFAISDPGTLSFQLAPNIVTEPQDQTVVQGQTATFIVAATGTDPLSYQWYFNQSEPIPGATGTTLELANVQSAQAGSYQVRVTNAAGSDTSLVAVLTVLLPPSTPAETLVVVATNTEAAVLSVPVAGTPPFQYQWYFEGTNLLENATNAQFLINPVSVEQSGLYSLRVTNPYGEATGLVSLIVRGEDFGDAPDPPYATLRSRNGPRHLIVPGLHLGAGVDHENDGHAGPGAHGDEDTGMADEDGVHWTSLVLLGQTVQFEVVASSNGFLNAWMDFDTNGAWASPSEQLFTDRPLVAGTNQLSFEVPLTAALGTTYARFRFNFEGGLTVTGPAANGEVEDYQVTILPAADLQVRVADIPDPVLAGNNVVVTASVTNVGPNQATGVTLLYPVPAGVQLLSSIPSQGNCTINAGLVQCVLGTVNSHGSASANFTWRSTAAGTKTNLVQVNAGQADPDPASNTALTTTAVIFASPVLQNQDAIVTPDFDIGPATPYPTSINVSGLTSTVYKVTVTLANVSHTFPDDFDILLVGPQGQSVILMSDCGSGFFTPINNVTLNFDDDAAQALPDFDQIVTGTYRPANYGSGDTFVAPAPAGPYGTALSVFRGINPNGTWSLFVMDDLPEDSGFIADGWQLHFTLLDPISDITVRLTDAPDPVAITSNLTYTVTVTNRGPAVATGVTVVDPLPVGTQFISAAGAQGACTLDQDIVRCTLATLNPGATASFTIRVAAVVGGVVSNHVTASSLRIDMLPDNNTASTLSTVLLVNDLEVTAAAAPDPVLLGQNLAYAISITNRGPYGANGVVLTDTLPSSFQPLSWVPNQGACSNAGTTVTCHLGSIPAFGSVSVQIVAQTTALGMMTNRASITESEADANVINDVALTTVMVVPAADLALSMTDSPDPVINTTMLTCSLLVSNKGPSAAGAVILENDLPATVQFSEAIPSQGTCTNLNGTVRCDLGALGAGATALVSIAMIPMQPGTVTNSARISSGTADPNVENNQASEVSTVRPTADLALMMTDTQDPVLISEPATYLMVVTNFGPNPASGVVVSNPLPAFMDFVSATATQGGCTNAAGVVRCDVGVLPPQGFARITLTLRPIDAGFLTNQASVSAVEADLVPANNTDQEVSTVIIDTGIFANPNSIRILDLAPAALYPSTIFVSGVTVRVDSVSITLSNLSHTYLSDLDVLVVGPGGQAVLLMSDAGGEAVSINSTFVFNDDANRLLPESGVVLPGTYKPTQYDPDSDSFPVPAPAPPYETNLSAFRGLDPNGTWSLYIVDDSRKDSGNVFGGWSLQLATQEALSDLALGMAALPSPVAQGSNLTYTITVTNRGPSTSTGPVVTDTLPSGVDLLSLNTDTGGCSNNLGVVRCDLGPMAAGHVAVITAQVLVNTLDLLSNHVQVAGPEIDVRPSNNEAVSIVNVFAPPSITNAPANLVVTNGNPVLFVVEATGQEPLFYQWFRNGVPLLDETNSLLLIASAEGIHAGAYMARVSNLVGAAESAPAVLTVIEPVTILTQPANLLVAAGNTVSFQVVVSGTDPSFAWFFNDMLMADAANGSLIISNAQPANSGSYFVVISNILNVVTSHVATLEVELLDFGDALGLGIPTLATANGPRHVLGPGVFLGALIDADPDGQPRPLADGDDLTGDDDEDGVRLLTPVVPGTTTVLEVVASTNGFLNAWVDFNGNHSWIELEEQVFTNQVLVAGTNRLEFFVPENAVQTPNTIARFRFSTIPNLGIDGPAIDGEVEDYALTIQRVVDLVVTIKDSPDPVRVGLNLVYTIGVTNYGLVTASNVAVSANVPRNMTVLAVTNSQGTCSDTIEAVCLLGDLAPGTGASMTVYALPLVSSMVTLTAMAVSTEPDFVPADNQAAETTQLVGFPTIVVPPANQVVAENQTAMFNVVATGELLQYQWRMNNAVIPFATNSLLILTNVQLNQAGFYSVSVSNILGGTVSSTATLGVLPLPVFVLQPTNQFVALGGNASLTAQADGPPPITYQWLFNGEPLAGKTNTTLAIAPVQADHYGLYRLRASNLAGSRLSDEAALLQPGTPAAMTLGVTSLSSTSVVLHGSANANGFDALAWFEWGGSPFMLNLATEPVPVGAASAFVPVTSPLFNLTAGQPYHYRLAVSNSIAVSRDQVLSFQWSAAAPVLTSIARLTNANTRLVFAAVSNQVYLVLGASNLVNFHVLGPASWLGPGDPSFEFLDTQSAAEPERFYRIQAP